MGTLSLSEFNAQLVEFITHNNAASKEKWTLHKSDVGLYAKQSVMMKWKDESINRQAHITYNNTYQVPVLWFNFYHRGGDPLNAEEVLSLSFTVNPESTLSSEPARSCPSESTSSASSVTLNEHPHLGVLFYHLHPCQTPAIMRELTGKGNYIASWLSFYGRPLGVAVPLSSFPGARLPSLPCAEAACAASSHCHQTPPSEEPVDIVDIALLAIEDSSESTSGQSTSRCSSSTVSDSASLRLSSLTRNSPPR